MKDRVPKYPGRVRLIPVAGKADTFDMVRADEPVEEGTPISKATLLSDEAGASIRLNKELTVNDAFKCLIPVGNSSGKVIFRFKDLYGAVANVLVTGLPGIEERDASAPDGVLCGYVPSGTYAYKIIWPVGYDEDNSTYEITVEANTYQLVEYSGTRNLNPRRITASTHIGIASYLKSFDVCAVGGGGSGGAAGTGYSWVFSAVAVSGGAGGYVRTKKDLAIGGDSFVLKITVGAGGEAASISTSLANQRMSSPGKAGGDTIIEKVFPSGPVQQLLSAAGGGGGRGSAAAYTATGINSFTSAGGADGGSGSGGTYIAHGVLNAYMSGANGSGGSGSSGQVLGGKGQGSTTRAFGEAEGEVFSSGGGGGGASTTNSSPYLCQTGSAGSPGGGKGAAYNSSPQSIKAGDGSRPGCGGGGACFAYPYSSSSAVYSAISGAGADGIVLIRGVA